MPKKYSIIDKRDWLEQYEAGASEAHIAKQVAHCDLRTLKRGLEEARNEREIRRVKSELLKKALIEHQDKLTAKLKEIDTSINVPEKDWVVLSWYRRGESVFERKRNVNPAGNSSPDLEFSQDLIKDMLREHLKDDELWDLLETREEAFLQNRNDRITFQKKVVETLAEITGLKLEERDSPRPFLYSYTSGDLFYKMSLRWAFGDRDTSWLDQIRADKSSGEVIYQGITLARTPGKEDKCRLNLLEAFKQLQSMPEAGNVVRSYELLHDATLKAKRSIEEILLLGLIQGQCRVCRRLGM
jgi:hypothetical protein